MTTMNNEDPADPSVHEQRELPEPTAWIDNVDLRGTLPDDGWCVVHSAPCDPCCEHNAYEPLYTADQMREAIADERERQTKPPKWWTCQTHGDAQPNAWGCPECVREMRADLVTHAALIAEVLAIASSGTLPDGDAVNTPTLLWAEEWARRLAEKEQP